MTEANIKRYTMAEIDAMIEAGQYFPTAVDAPEIELGDEFWSNAERVNPAASGTTVVRLRLNSAVVDQYRQEGPGHLLRMAKVLEDHLPKKMS